MNRLQYKFSGKTTTYYFDADFAYLEKLVNRQQAVILTDEHVFQGHQKKFKGWNTIVIQAGEATDKPAQGYLGCVLMRLGRVQEANNFMQRAGPGAWTSCTPLPTLAPQVPGAQAPVR